MFTTALFTRLIPVFIFMAIAAIGLVLKRVLPATTTIHLPEAVLIGLSAGGIILAVLLTAFLVLMLNGIFG